MFPNTWNGERGARAEGRFTMPMADFERNTFVTICLWTRANPVRDRQRNAFYRLLRPGVGLEAFAVLSYPKMS